MDVKAYLKVHLILGRSFMKTTRMLMDIENGKVKARMKDHDVSYKVIGLT